MTHAIHPSRAELVNPQWLEDHLGDPGVRLVEIDVSPAAYDQGHIEGAVLWNVYRDLKTAEYRAVAASEVERLFTRSGITADDTVVFYGYAPAMGFWLMKLYGHADARILDCGRETWRDEGRSWTTTVTPPDPTTYPLPHENGLIRASRSMVADAIDDPRRILLDVRSDLEFSGERFWPSGGLEEGGRAGHVPNAVNISIDDSRDARGAFRDDGYLREWYEACDLGGDRELISYCTIGGRACTAWFVLTYLLGRPGVRVYDGSWAEWGRLPLTPVSCS